MLQKTVCWALQALFKNAHIDFQYFTKSHQKKTSKIALFWALLCEI